MEKNVSWKLDITSDNNQLQREIEQHLMELRMVIRFNEIDPEEGDGFVKLNLNKQTKEDLIKSQINKCYKGMATSILNHMDRLLSVLILSKEPLIADRNVKKEEILSFIEEKRQKLLQKISQDKKLSIPKKLDYFLGDTGFEKEDKEFIFNYFKLRHALEHHHNKPKLDIFLKYRVKPRIYIDGEEIDKNYTLKTGQLLELIREVKTKFLKEGEEIILSVEELEDIGFTIMIEITNIFSKAFDNKIRLLNTF